MFDCFLIMFCKLPVENSRSLTHIELHVLQYDHDFLFIVV